MGMSADARLFFSHDGVQVCYHPCKTNLTTSILRMLCLWYLIGEGDDVFFPPAGSAVTDLVGGHEKKHRGVEAPAHLLLSSLLLHQPHFFQVKPFSWGRPFHRRRCKVHLKFQLLHRKEEEQKKEEKCNDDGLGRDTDSLYGTTVFSFSDIKHM